MSPFDSNIKGITDLGAMRGINLKELVAKLGQHGHLLFGVVDPTEVLQLV